MVRNEIPERLRERASPWDIVVIGGGATGVGCALDAASRGYEVLLLEQHDFGKGTSSRSTKMIHGGVRYVRQGDLSLVREALKERSILLQNAPHVVHRQAFIVPCFGPLQKLYYGIGLKLYDLLSGRHGIGRSRMISKSETLGIFPTLNANGLFGGVLYYDGHFDDTRLLIDLAKTARSHGAELLNYARVLSFTKNAGGRISGLKFEDVETGVEVEVSARAIINATGIFCDPVRQMADAKAKPVVTFAQGIHIVLDKGFLTGDTALMIPRTNDGRVLFCIPWHGHTLVGTTDTPVGSAEIEPTALESEIDFVLENAGQYLAQKPKRSDILSVFAGIRPLVRSGKSDKTSSISRSHDLFVDDAGLVTITGGKWTTYRRMAEEAVDKASRIGKLEGRASVTAGLTIKGTETTTPGSSSRLHPDMDYTAEDVVIAVRDEMARTVEDVLARRTRVLFLNARAAIELAGPVAKIMAAELGKDNEWIALQIDEFKTIAQNYLAR